MNKLWADKVVSLTLTHPVQLSIVSSSNHTIRIRTSTTSHVPTPLVMLRPKRTRQSQWGHYRNSIFQNVRLAKGLRKFTFCFITCTTQVCTWNKIAFKCQDHLEDVDSVVAAVSDSSRAAGAVDFLVLVAFAWLKNYTTPTTQINVLYNTALVRLH